MTLERLAARYHALEAVDASEFQRKARIMQSLWREQRGLPPGEHNGRPLGSRLLMPDAQTHLWNFLSDNIKDVVRREVLGPTRDRGKLIRTDRLLANLLSSQPLCFNLFGELKCDLGLATAAMRSLTEGRVHDVTSVEFEHSPGRRDPRYTGDNSAFDVFMTFATPSGRKGFVGIEVKYHENLLGKAARHKDRYDDIAAAMGCFAAGAATALKRQPLQQVWRDHLLAGILRHADGFDDGLFMMLYPKGNPHCRAAVSEYRKCLVRSDTFVGLTLEDLLAEIGRHTGAPWVHRVYDRYVDFGKLDALLQQVD